MQRYFVEPGQLQAESVTILGEDVHHLIHVMRAKVGDSFICSNGIDREVLAKIQELDKSSVLASVESERAMANEPKLQIWVAQSLPKGDKLETIIQKGTEVGAAVFLPFLSERTIVQYDERKEAKRLERWRRIAKEAAEQAHRNRIPVVEQPVSWKGLLQRATEMDLTLCCYEKENAMQLREILLHAFTPSKQSAVKRIMIVVGPEGGFSEREMLEAEGVGCRVVSLGKRILRTETAALVALTCILYENGEMGG